MTAHRPIAAADTGPALQPGWRAHLIALFCLAAAILLLFRRDAADMARIWWTSDTYNHCVLIPPIIAWLVWQRLPGLRRMVPVAWAPGVVLVGAGAAGWLLGEAGGVGLARHAGLVLMLQGAVIACLGKAVTRALAFPFFYALFLIPAGDGIVPLMQTVTARIAMALLGLTGVPAHLDGIFITIPNGYFRVAEACAGVNFLIAMIALGALAANLCFTAWRRRLLFMLAAAALPILANGARAWGTIYVAHLTDLTFAAGFDHIVYGWFFFALVVALLIGVGWRFFDRRPTDPWFDPATLQAEGTPADPTARLAAIAACAAALALLPPLWSTAVAASGMQPAPADIVLPDVPGWHRISGEGGRYWEPHFAGADVIRMGRYQDAAGHEVDLAIALFARQGEGREIVGFGQGAAGANGWSWSESRLAPSGGRADRIASFGTVREVATFYRVGASLTGSEYRVKLETVKTRLLGGPQRAVAVLVSAQGPDPRASIDAFLAELGPIEALADRAAGL